jgi:(p)ppGpp synthase/HD superfamily hydrolase
MNVIQQAINFAAKAHECQKRKSTDIPYITHPFAVGMLLQKAKCSDAVIAAGILHDTLEDTNTKFEQLAEQFGVHIANLVRSASEQDKSLPWYVRKQHTIDMLKEAYIEEIQVITADKLHNLQSIRADLEMVGEEVWKRFSHGKRDQHWYYASIVKELAPRKKEFKLIRELGNEVEAVFGRVQVLSDQEITLLFHCAYDIDNQVQKLLQDHGLIEMAEEISREAKRIFDVENDLMTMKLDDLCSRGIQFQSNSEGPFILASFCIALQKKMGWTDQELYKHFKRNQSIL